MEEHGPRISRGALARMTGATALGLAGRAGGGIRRPQRQSHDHLHRSGVLDGRPRGRCRHGRRRARGRVRARRPARDRRPLPGRGRARRPAAASSSASARSACALAGSTEATTTDTIYDLESMTKVLATATAAMLLVERGQALAHCDRSRSTCRTSPPTARAACSCATCCATPRACPSTTRRSTRTTSTRSGRFMEETPLEYPTGSIVEYSDLGYRLLGAPRRDGRRARDLDTFAKHEIWGPLGMADTTYNPAAVARPALRGDRAGLAQPAPRPAARLGAGRPGLEGRRHRRLRRRLRDRARRRDLQPDDPQRRRATATCACCRRSSSPRWSPTRRRR